MHSIPALFQVLIIFAALIVATARKVHLGLAAAVGGMLLALWRGMGPLAVARAAVVEAIKPDTLLLVALMAWIMAFSAAMKRSGAMDAFSRSLVAIAPSPRFAMAIAPLLIGTLPMPGGAILSAPLVDAMDPRRERDPDVLSAANYWFRHCLELAWPLYPAFILTASLTGLSAGRLAILNFYAPPVVFTLGLLFILRMPRRSGTLPSREIPVAREPFGRRLTVFAAGVAPLALVLGTYIALDIAWKAIAPSFGLPPAAAALFARYLPIFLGLSAGSLYVVAGSSGVGAFKGSVGGSTFKLIAVIIGIRVFSSLLGVAGVASAAAGELASAGIPTVVAIAALPFVAGLVTGVGFGYVGLAFPIILGLAPAGGPFPREAAIVLAGAFGYVGMMLSPLHVCMVVSAEHFGVGLASTIRRFALPLTVFAAIATVYVSLLTAWLT